MLPIIYVWHSPMNHTDSNQPDIDRDEVHFCPHCNRLTRHSVTRERVLMPVLWCLSCFHTHMGEDGIEADGSHVSAETPRPSGPQAGA